MARQIPIDPFLEQNYNLATRPDLADILQDWNQQSATFRNNADASLDCVYGDEVRDRIDVFRCGEADAPLYIYIHGGYWQRGDKSIYSFIAQPFVEARVDVALIGYPLCPEVSLTGLVESIQNALSWLYRNAALLGVNADRINLSGHSAGGHLAALGVCTHWSRLAGDLPADLLKTAIPLSGLYQLEPLCHTTIDEAVNLSATEIRLLSPRLLKPIGKAPVLAVLGGAETDEFFRQTDELLESWADAGLNIERFIEPGVDHFDLVYRLANSESEIFQRIRSWLR